MTPFQNRIRAILDGHINEEVTDKALAVITREIAGEVENTLYGLIPYGCAVPTLVSVHMTDPRALEVTHPDSVIDLLREHGFIRTL